MVQQHRRMIDQVRSTDPKVVVRIRGGLGNQLFCYAAARRLALANGAELVLDHVSGFRKRRIRRTYALHHFHIEARTATARERLDGPLSLRKFRQRLAARMVPMSRAAYIHERGMASDARLLARRVRGPVYVNGLWQSEHYFCDIEATLRCDLRFHEPTDRANLDMAARIRACNALALHVRSFREASYHQRGLSRPERYYASAAELALRRCGEPQVFVFSDDPDLARRLLQPIGVRAEYVTHNNTGEQAYADLWLMSLCRHFIIADSTFSWWGAWLGAHPGKQVFAPGAALLTAPASWGIPGQLPDRWMKL